MIKDKKSFIRELTIEEELQNNRLALVLSLQPDIDISKREKFLDNILAFYNRPDLQADRLEAAIEEGDAGIYQWLGKDLRIKQLTIKSVRGIPDNPIPYGIDFRNGTANPHSMIILGGNGFGKSSIYGSLEFAYSKRIGEARLRTQQNMSDDSDSYRDYLRHFGNGFDNCFFQLETVDHTFTLQDENMPKAVREKINPGSHFLSDCDIYEQCKLNYENGGEASFHNTIAINLGLKELLEFEKHLKAFIAYDRRVEILRIAAIEKTLAQSGILIESAKQAILQKEAKLDQLLNSQSAIPEINKGQGKITVLKKLRERPVEVQLPNLEEIAGNFRRAYTAYVAIEHKNASLNQLQFLKLGTELLKTATNCPLCDSSSKSTTEILAYVQQKIKEIESFNMLSKELVKAGDDFAAGLDAARDKLNLLQSWIGQEWKETSAHTEFNDWSIRTSQFQSTLESALANDFFQSLATRYSDTQTIESRNHFLFEIAENHQEFIRQQWIELQHQVAEYIHNRQAFIAALEEQLAPANAPQTHDAQVAVLQKEVERFQKQVADLEKKEALDNLELLKWQDQLTQYLKIKEETKAFVQVLHARLNQKVLAAFEPVKEIVEQVLEYYLVGEGRNVQVQIAMEPEHDPETGEVLSEIITAKVVEKNGSQPSISVNRYFNTFHYRLFATMIGLSIAIASRRQTGINLPLVFDDIFYASDFENRVTIEEFLKKIIRVFNKFTPALPLQIIMFTHDQLIFETAVEIMQEEGQDQIAFAKMFPPSQAVLENDEFLNLVYNYPHNLSKKLVNILFGEYDKKRY